LYAYTDIDQYKYVYFEIRLLIKLFINYLVTAEYYSMTIKTEPNTVDVTLHIDEELSHGNLEDFRDVLLHEDGVYAASFHDERPHLMIIAD